MLQKIACDEIYQGFENEINDKKRLMTHLDANWYPAHDMQNIKSIQNLTKVMNENGKRKLVFHHTIMYICAKFLDWNSLEWKKLKLKIKMWTFSMQPEMSASDEYECM